MITYVILYFCARLFMAVLSSIADSICLCLYLYLYSISVCECNSNSNSYLPMILS